jgi:probable HAF family extracellular repeat protein
MRIGPSIVLVAAAGSALGQDASFTPLGNLGGGSMSSLALGISPDGTVVVGESESPNGNEAFYWVNGVMTPLGYLPGGDTVSRIYAASTLGDILAGESWNGVQFEAARSQSFGPLVGLGALIESEKGLLSAAFGVSADGHTIIGYSRSNNGAPETLEAVRWVDGEIEGLGDLPGGLAASVARGVSNDGSVIVGDGVSENGSEAFRWVSGKMSGLGDLEGGAFASQAFDVSADGSVIVGSGETAEGTEAFRWEAGQMVNLGDLPGSDAYARANGVSADGNTIVGVGYSADDEFEAFLWTPGTGMVNLREHLISEFGLGGALEGWILFEAAGVSDDGAAIVGSGLNPGFVVEGWIVRLPGAACYADFTGDGELDIFDFLGFVNAFNAGEDIANCDDEGGLDLFDFLCFTNTFNAGC